MKTELLQNRLCKASVSGDSNLLDIRSFPRVFCGRSVLKQSSLWFAAGCGHPEMCYSTERKQEYFLPQDTASSRSVHPQIPPDRKKTGQLSVLVSTGKRQRSSQSSPLAHRQQTEGTRMPLAGEKVKETVRFRAIRSSRAVTSWLASIPHRHPRIPKYGTQR